MSIETDAKKIAETIAATRTDHRNELYDAIAAELAKNTQHFTAKLFRWIADMDRGHL